MARRSRTQITKEHALKIADKLEAVSITTKSDVHDQYGVYHEGQLLATFGVRRASRMGKGHDYIPGELNVGPNFAKQLAHCTKFRRDYLIRIGIIPAETDDNANPDG